MKMTKVLSLILALSMVLTVFGIGIISASAAEDEEPAPVAAEAPKEVAVDATEAETTPPETGDVSTTGAWEFSGVAADNCTQEEKDIFTKALSDIGGASYEPKDVIATQTVAGTNYAFLCVTTPVVPNAESHWSIVTVYADLEGNAKVINVADVDPASLSTLDNAPEAGDGAWTSKAKEKTADVPQTVSDALANNDGIALSPIAILGTQLVAGTNYRILCYGTTATAEPQTNLYVADVYEAVDGTAEITAVSVFDLAAYVTPDIEEDEDPTEAPTEAATEKKEDAGEGKSPDTGYTELIMLVMLLMLTAAAGTFAAVKAIAKKHD